MAFGRRLVLVKVELDLGAVGVVEEQLPDATSGKAEQLVLDPFAFQCRDRPGQVSAVNAMWSSTPARSFGSGSRWITCKIGASPSA